jgi:hypothetical protein
MQVSSDPQETVDSIFVHEPEFCALVTRLVLIIVADLAGRLPGQYRPSYLLSEDICGMLWTGSQQMVPVTRQLQLYLLNFCAFIPVYHFKFDTAIHARSASSSSSSSSSSSLPLVLQPDVAGPSISTVKASPRMLLKRQKGPIELTNPVGTQISHKQIAEWEIKGTQGQVDA